MLKLLLGALLVTGCSAKKEEPAVEKAPEPRASVTDPIGYCERARRVMTGRIKCFPEDTSIKMGLEELADIVAKAPTDPEPRRKAAATCAGILDGMVRATQPKNCPLDVTDEERAELEAFLTAWKRDKAAAETK